MSDPDMSDHVRAVGLAGLLRQGSPVDPHAGEREREAALAEAYANGLRDGEAAMLAAFAEVRADEAVQHAASLAAANAAQQSLIETVSECLAELAMQVARAVVAAEPLVRLETVQSLVAEAIAAAPAEAGGIILVSPPAQAAAQSALPPGWTCESEPGIAPGTARAVLGAGAFTASLDRRLVHLATLMTEAD